LHDAEPITSVKRCFGILSHLPLLLHQCLICLPLAEDPQLDGL